MTTRAANVLIGLFVLGALLLLLLSVAIVGSGRLFSSQYGAVIFFDSSVRGLSPGSPVVFRGVTIGRVSDIRMAGDLQDMKFRLPVFIRLDRNSIENMTIDRAALTRDQDFILRMIRKGLSGRLTNQSLLTGQLLIELDFFGTGARAPDEVEFFGGYPVIPGVRSQFETVWEHIANLPVDKLAGNLLDISQRIGQLLELPGLVDIPANLNATLDSAQSAMRRLDEAAARVTDASGQLARLAAGLTEQTPRTLETTRALLFRYTQLADQVEQTMNGLRGVVGPNTLTVLTLNKVIRELGETAQAVRALVNTLERHPESLLMGRGERK
jgi:paraquat-inducible protein B